MREKVRLRDQKAAATRQALIDAGRRLFADRGYHAVGIREITESAGVTRGSLYHHFGDKESLFLAVFDAVERDLMIRAESRRRSPGSDHWHQFRRGLQAYLDVATEPEVRQITLIDAPAVLGWERWRALEADYGLGAIINALNSSMGAKLIRKQPARPLAHLILSSVNEAALLIANSSTPDKTRVEIGKALDALLNGLK